LTGIADDDGFHCRIDFRVEQDRSQDYRCTPTQA
jgi:hypothetical protein